MWLRSVMAGAVVLCLACTGADTAVVAPPVQLVAAPTRLAFEGLYATEIEDEVRSYLRFYPDGHVSSVSSTGTPEDVAAWLGRSHSDSGQGDYEQAGAWLAFHSSTSFGTVAYEGQLDGTALRLHWTSQINGAEGDDTYHFVPVSLTP